MDSWNLNQSDHANSAAKDVISLGISKTFRTYGVSVCKCICCDLGSLESLHSLNPDPEELPKLTTLHAWNLLVPAITNFTDGMLRVSGL